jgi:hypothetical protein
VAVAVGIILTAPITVTSAERSLSKLIFINSATSQERLARLGTFDGRKQSYCRNELHEHFSLVCKALWFCVLHQQCYFIS